MIFYPNSRYFENNTFDENEVNIFFGSYEIFESKNLEIQPYAVDYFALMLCTEGSFYINANNRKYKLEKGSLFLTPLYTKIEKELISDSTKTMYILLKGASLNKYFSVLGFSNENALFPYPLEEEQFKLMDEIIKLVSDYTVATYKTNVEQAVFKHFQKLEQATIRRMRRRGLFYIFLSELFTLFEANSENSDSHSGKKEYIRRAIEYIEANKSADVNVDKIADHLGLNRSYLYKLFKSELGVSVRDFIIQTKIRTACSLLKNPEFSIKSVAFSINYDPITFARIFKQRIGMTPSQYRKENITPHQ